MGEKLPEEKPGTRNEIPKQLPIDYVRSFGNIYAFDIFLDLNSTNEGKAIIQEMLNNPDSVNRKNLQNDIYQYILSEWKDYTNVVPDESKLFNLAKEILDRQIYFQRIKNDILKE